MILASLADRVANLACVGVPAHLGEIRAAVYAKARRAALDALEAVAWEGTAPDVTGHAHEAAYAPQMGGIVCVRRLPDGGRCPVRFRAYLPPAEETTQTTGEHRWLDAADNAEARGGQVADDGTPVPPPLVRPPGMDRRVVPPAADAWATVRALDGIADLGGDALADSEALYEPDQQEKGRP